MHPRERIAKTLLTKGQLEELLKALPGVRVGVIGDFCLDVYWELDLSASERSVETGLMTRPVRGQRCEPGGAGNIVNNLAAMGVGTVRVFGVVGADPFGREMRRLLDARGADGAGLLEQTQDWDTLAYLKPIREGREENRLDFGNFNRLHDAVAAALLERLEAALPALDIVIVNQQVAGGIHTAFLQDGLDRLMARHAGASFIADCRHVPGAYVHCLRRFNEVEAVRQCGSNHEYGGVVSLEEADAAARKLFVRSQKPVFVSRGARGALVADADGLHVIPGLHIVNPTDPVGAGDSMLAGMAAALAAGRSPAQAAVFGNFAAGVTVQKLFQTGTASPAEILAIGADPDYVYGPVERRSRPPVLDTRTGS